nr:DUF6318 family protein [Rothia sp. RSM386]
MVNGVPQWQEDYFFDVAPESTHELAIPWPLEEYAADNAEVTLDVSLVLTEDAAWAPAGHEIAFGQYVIPASQAEANTAEDAADATVTVGRWNVGLRNNQAEVILSRTQGGFVSWVHNGTEHVIRPPKLTTFRPLTDNDRGAGHGFERAQWTVAGRYVRCANVAVEQPSDDSVAVTYTYELATPAHTAVTVRYEAQSTGNVRVTIDYPGEKDAPSLPAFGLEWALPGEFSHLRYYGLGPGDSYPDRCSGVRLGVWESTPEQDYAPYLVPQESGTVGEKLIKGEAWMHDASVVITMLTPQPEREGDTYNWNIRLTMDPGEFIASKDRVQEAPSEAERKDEVERTLHGVYENGAWKLTGMRAYSSSSSSASASSSSSDS